MRFLWGAATSAHQIEGNNINSDFWAWEQQGKNKSGRACDSYNRYKEDFAIASKLGHNAHRLSIEWARIEPVEGEFDPNAIGHYRQVLLELQRLKIKPVVTLHHFVNPLWVSLKGGWENPKVVRWFARYGQKCVQAFGDLVDTWITINEPNIYVQCVYLEGKWLDKQNWLKALPVFLNLGQAHNLAYQEIKKGQPKSTVGLAMNVTWFEPGTSHSWDRFIAFGLRQFVSDIMWWPFKNLDFMGLNYYFGMRIVNTKPMHIYDFGKTDSYEWGIFPEGIYKVVMDLWGKHHKPIMVTENGISDSQDKMRVNFIESHINCINRARREGVDIRGYLYWSLLDNWEWHMGFTPRFGLVKVDYKHNFKRTIRPSAFVYSKMLK